MRNPAICLQRKNIKILTPEISPPLFCGTQLDFIGGYLLVQKTLRIRHIGSVRSRCALHKNVHQRRDNVARKERFLIAILNGEQVASLTNHLYCLSEARY